MTSQPITADASALEIEPYLAQRRMTIAQYLGQPDKVRMQLHADWLRERAAQQAQAQQDATDRRNPFARIWRGYRWILWAGALLTTARYWA